MPHPLFVRVRQTFERPTVHDIPRATTEALERLNLAATIRPGQTVALTAGSRGIANIPIILRSVVQHLQRLGAQPFIVPAMGSHGGGTTEGQVKILHSYGITEDALGAPIRASMEVVSLGSTPEGWPVVLDRHASQADHLGVIGRIKPHTAYHGPIESGLLKMLMIGLGKHVGALEYHRILMDQPYDRLTRSVSRHLLDRVPVAFGLGVVENAYDETALIQGVLPTELEVEEERLLSLARRWLPQLPCRQADLLVVDEIGKDISGSGMDTNVVGRKRAFRGQAPPPDFPAMRLIFVRGLSARTHGNATGIGLADFTTTRLVRAMNYRDTVINCLTAGYPEGAFLPVHFDSDREVLQASLKILGSRRPEEARVLWIRNTLCLEELTVSEAALDQCGEKGRVEVLSSAQPLNYDPEGNLIPREE